MSKDPLYPVSSVGQMIDRQAKAVMDRFLTKDCLVHRIVENDFGRDYLVELLLGSQPSGTMFHVQLKGSRVVTFDKTGHTHWPIQTRHLRYYWDRVAEPVFLVVADVTAEQGWFCFVQGQLASPEAKAKLGAQKSLTLDLRLDHSLADAAKLRAAVDEARRFMREKNPGSLQAALRAAAAEHSTIDPHFTVTGAEINGANTCFKLTPKAPFSFKIHVPSPTAPAVVPRLQDLFRYGRPIELTTDEVEFEGLPLFSHSKTKGLSGHLAFTTGNALPCEITLSTDQKAHPFSLTLVGKMSRGTDGGLIVGQLKDAPLGIELLLNREQLLEQKAVAIEFTWDLFAWIGQPLSTLAQLEPLAGFWETLQAGSGILATITQSGNRLFRGRFGRKSLPKRYRSLHALCLMLRQAREIAILRHFATKLPDAKQLLDFDWTDIELAHSLVIAGRSERAAPNFRMRVEPLPGNKKFKAQFKDKKQIEGFIRVVMNPYSINAFGERWELGDAILEAGPVIVRQSDAAGKGLAEILGRPRTRLSVTRAGTPEPQAPSDK